MVEVDDLKFDEHGLVPVVVQDAQCGQVLMFAFANKEAIRKTLETGKAHFWSRSRQRLWRKGEESGNEQTVRSVHVDCDNDCILLLVEQKGVACHTGQRSCFHRALGNVGDKAQEAPSWSGGRSGRGRTLDEVHQVVDDRLRNPRPDSYVGRLKEKGIDAVLKKMGEEAAETIVAIKNGDPREIVYETADLMFHTLVALALTGLSPADVYEELGRRFGRRKEEYER